MRYLHVLACAVVLTHSEQICNNTLPATFAGIGRVSTNVSKFVGCFHLQEGLVLATAEVNASQNVSLHLHAFGDDVSQNVRSLERENGVHVMGTVQLSHPGDWHFFLEILGGNSSVAFFEYWLDLRTAGLVNVTTATTSTINATNTTITTITIKMTNTTDTKSTNASMNCLHTNNTTNATHLNNCTNLNNRSNHTTNWNNGTTSNDTNVSDVLRIKNFTMDRVSNSNRSNAGNVSNLTFGTNVSATLRIRNFTMGRVGDGSNNASNVSFHGNGTLTKNHGLVGSLDKVTNNRSESRPGQQPGASLRLSTTAAPASNGSLILPQKLAVVVDASANWDWLFGAMIVAVSGLLLMARWRRWFRKSHSSPALSDFALEPNPLRIGSFEVDDDIMVGGPLGGRRVQTGRLQGMSGGSDGGYVDMSTPRSSGRQSRWESIRF